MKCECFIGGTSISADRKKIQGCHIVIGTPGRLQALIEENSLITETIRVVILDEVDKLFDDSFALQTRQLLLSLPERKQLLAFSATFEAKLLAELETYMRNPTVVDLCGGDVKLKGVTQYVCRCDSQKNAYEKPMKKSAVILDILNKTSFNQCLIFCNDIVRGEKLSKILIADGWPSALLHGSQTQQDRNKIMQSFRDSEMRVLISSDLIARGVDLERVNLVINLDLPRDPETYMHRVGRTGRFGTFGIAISLVNSTEYATLKKFRDQFGLILTKMPLEIPSDLYHFDESNSARQIMDKNAQSEPKSKKSDDSLSVSSTDQVKKSRKRKRNEPYSPSSKKKKVQIETESINETYSEESEFQDQSSSNVSSDITQSIPSDFSFSEKNPSSDFYQYPQDWSYWNYWQAAQEYSYHQQLWQNWSLQMQWQNYLHSFKSSLHQQNQQPSPFSSYPREDLMTMMNLIQGKFPM